MAVYNIDRIIETQNEKAQLRNQITDLADRDQILSNYLRSPDNKHLVALLNLREEELIKLVVSNRDNATHLELIGKIGMIKELKNAIKYAAL